MKVNRGELHTIVSAERDDSLRVERTGAGRYQIRLADRRHVISIEVDTVQAAQLFRRLAVATSRLATSDRSHHDRPTEAGRSAPADPEGDSAPAIPG